MTNAERVGYRLTAWAQSHPIAAKTAAWIMLVLAAFAIFGFWSRISSGQLAKPIMVLVAIVIVIVAAMLVRRRPRAD